MPLDMSIYQNLLRPPKSVAEYDAEALTNQQNRLAIQSSQAQLQDRQRSIDDGNKLRQAVSGFGADQTANYNALLGTGNLKAAQDYQKANVDTSKTVAEAAHLGAQTDETHMKAVNLKMGQAKDMLNTMSSPDQAALWVKGMYSDPDLAKVFSRGGDTAEAAIARIPTDPKGFADWKMKASLGADKLIEYTTPSANTVLTTDTQVKTNAATNAQLDTDNRRTTDASRYQADKTAGTAKNRLDFDKEQATAENAPDTTSQKEKELWLHTYTANNGQMPRSAPPSVRKYIGTWAAEMGITPNDLSSGAAKAKFDQAMAVTAGHRGGAMASVEATMPALVENAQDLSHKLGQGKFVPLNQLVQMADSNISDPTLAAFKVAHMAVVSEYQQVISRGGTNVTALNEAMHVLNKAQSMQAYDSAMNQVKKEVAINVAGSKAVRDGLGAAGHGAAPPAAPPAAPAGFDSAAIAAELKKRGH